VDNVVKELNKGNVRELVINGGIDLKGRVCIQGHYIQPESSDKKKCEICGNELEKSDHFSDDITEYAYSQGAKILHVLHPNKEIEKNKAGAFLRY
ncbi:MAG: hypothetical protein ACOC5R_03590, partial [Elusimicrobiota bacterium]